MSVFWSTQMWHFVSDRKLKSRASVDKLDQHFLLKPKSQGKPKIDLGATIGTCVFEKESGKSCWSIGSKPYVKAFMNGVEAPGHLAKHERELKSKPLEEHHSHWDNV